MKNKFSFDKKFLSVVLFMVLVVSISSRAMTAESGFSLDDSHILDERVSMDAKAVLNRQPYASVVAAAFLVGYIVSDLGKCWER